MKLGEFVISAGILLVIVALSAILTTLESILEVIR